ncbi:hypothetical protein DPMN_069739, partial [Dreissena polymorpha]
MTKVKVLGQTHTYKNRQTDRPKTNIPPIIRSGCIQIIPFHEDPTMNVASTVLTRQIFMTHKGRQTIEKMSSQKFTMSNKLYAHKIVTIFEDDIIQTNRCHSDLTNNVTK